MLIEACLNRGDAPRPAHSLAHVSNLGHAGKVKPIIFYPITLEWIRGEDPMVRREIGEALRDLQKGLHLGMPKEVLHGND